MKSTQYSEKVMDHFKNPRNVGMLEGENVAVGRVGNPVCGDLMEISIKVEDDKIEDFDLGLSLKDILGIDDTPPEIPNQNKEDIIIE